MTDTEREHVEERLHEERDRAVRALQRIDEVSEDDGELTQYRQHLADEGTDTMEQEKALMLLGKEGELLLKIDRALRRLYREPESFGRCERCGTEISMERLEIVPWSRLCVTCKEAEEAGTG